MTDVVHSASHHPLLSQPPAAAKPAAPTNVQAKVLATTNGISTVRLSWASSSSTVVEWGIFVDGVPIGLTNGTVTSVEVSDANRGQDVTLRVAGLTADKVVGAVGTVVLTVERVQPPGVARIDIKPGLAGNPINLRSRGVEPVALLSSPGFNASAVDYRTVCFGDAEAPAEHDCSEAYSRGHIEDVDGDGDADLVLHFEVQQTGIDAGDTRACMTGKTPTGAPFEACDTIRVVGKK